MVGHPLRQRTGLEPWSDPDSPPLCDFGQASWLLWALVFTPPKWGEYSTPFGAQGEPIDSRRGPRARAGGSSGGQ